MLLRKAQPRTIPDGLDTFKGALGTRTTIQNRQSIPILPFQFTKVQECKSPMPLVNTRGFAKFTDERKHVKVCRCLILFRGPRYRRRPRLTRHPAAWSVILSPNLYHPTCPLFNRFHVVGNDHRKRREPRITTTLPFQSKVILEVLNLEIILSPVAIFSNSSIRQK